MNDIQIKATYSVAIWLRSLSPLFIVLIAFSLSFADDTIAISGRLDLRGVKNLYSDSVKEEPGLTGRIKIDTPLFPRLRSEAGIQDHSTRDRSPAGGGPDRSRVCT